ncbi:MAG: DUF6612 family protein [Bacillota bacterium]
MIRRSASVLLIAILLLLGGSVLAADEVGISVDGVFYKPEVPAQIVDGSTMVPLRFLSTALGADVGWDEATSTAIVRKGYSTDLAITTPIHAVRDGRTKLEINGEIKDVKLVRISDRLMVPLRFISETFGALVDWDGTTNTVVIKSKQAQVMELLLTSNHKLLEADGYAFTNTGTVTVSTMVDGQKQDMEMVIRQQGAFNKPSEFHFTMLTQLADMPDAPAPVPPVEMYLKGSSLHVKLPSGLWQKTEVPDISQLTSQYDPAMYIEMLKGLNPDFETNPYTDSGRQYIVVKSEFSGAKLYEVVKGLMADLMPQAQADDPEAQAAMEQVMNTMTGFFAYLINAQDLSLAEAHVEISALVDFPGIPAPMQVSVVMGTTYSIGANNEMPTITPEMIAPDQPAETTTL